MVNDIGLLSNSDTELPFRFLLTVTKPTPSAKEWGGPHFNHLGGNEKASFALWITTTGIKAN